MSTIATFPHGRLETTGDNEIKHASDIADPGKYRFSVREALVESNLGATTFNTERPDGHLDERASIGARLLPDGSPAIFIAIADHKGDPIREILLISRYGLSGPAAPQNGSMPLRIALRAVANGRLVCAENAGQQPLIANRDAVGAWETFEVIFLA